MRTATVQSFKSGSEVGVPLSVPLLRLVSVPLLRLVSQCLFPSSGWCPGVCSPPQVGVPVSVPLLRLVSRCLFPSSGPCPRSLSPLYSVPSLCRSTLIGRLRAAANHRQGAFKSPSGRHIGQTVPCSGRRRGPTRPNFTAARCTANRPRREAARTRSPPPPAHRRHTEQMLERHRTEARRHCPSRPRRRADPARRGFGIQPPPFPQCRLTPCPLSPRTLSLAEASCRALIQSNTTEDGHRM
ncbi:PREDICTED: uncharacterized protein LOC108804604 [Nanorana parkeri]|uniref:uncharacterized protein LOC108804604 n=1 Tax=Nanorana parkeri TaxID=125878 RepID=UPI000854DEAF|nr:PREDICTED: uncharacterized protein LOC108804604 [Nanorana parkeri]